jgi:hypothetical protein
MLVSKNNPYRPQNDPNKLVDADDVPLNTKDEIQQVFGKYFCDLVGIDNLMKMPRVSGQSLDYMPDYPQPVKCIQKDGYGTLFRSIACTIEVCENNKKLADRKLVIASRSPHIFNYSTTESILNQFLNYIPLVNYLNNKPTQFKDFFDGKTIQVSTGTKRIIFQNYFAVEEEKKSYRNPLYSNGTIQNSCRVENNSETQLQKNSENRLDDAIGNENKCSAENEKLPLNLSAIDEKVPNSSQAHLIENDPSSHETEQQIQQIREAFGSWFCNAVGMKNLLKMKKVSFDPHFEDFLENDCKEAFENGCEDAFKEIQINGVVKGTRRNSTPFIACSIAVYDNDTQLSQNHLLVFTKTPELMHGWEIYKVYNKCLDTKDKTSCLDLYAVSPDKHTLKDLFKKKEITAPRFLQMPNKHIKLTRPSPTETLRAEQENSSPCGKDDEEARLDEVTASQNSPNHHAHGIQQNNSSIPSNSLYSSLSNDQLKSVFGDWFCNFFGFDNLKKMKQGPEPFFEDMKNDVDDACKIVKENAAVKGFRKNYPSLPFIACTIRVFDPGTHVSRNHILKIAKQPEKDAYTIHNKCLDTDEKVLLSHLSADTIDGVSLKLLFDGKILHISDTKNAFLGMPGKSIELVCVW